MNKKICAKCGNEGEMDSKFCMYCGSSEFISSNATTVLGDNESNDVVYESEPTTVLDAETPLFADVSAFVSEQQPATSANNGEYYQPPMQQNSGFNQQYYQPQQPLNQNVQAQFNQSPFPAYQPPQVDDNPSSALRTLSWFFPIVGIILYAVKKEKTPNSAKSYLKIALISIAVNLIATIVLGVIGAVTSNTTDYSSSYSDDYSYTEEKSFELGVVTENTYYNNYIDLHLDLPSDEWRFLAVDEIYQTVAGDGVSIDEETGKVCMEVSGVKTYYDFALANDITNDNMFVQLTEAELDMSKGMFLESTMSGIEQEYASLGFEVVEKNADAGMQVINNNYYTYGYLVVKSPSDHFIRQLMAVGVVEDSTVTICITTNESQETLLEYLDLFY